MMQMWHRVAVSRERRARVVTIGLRHVYCCLRRSERGVVIGLRHLVGDMLGKDDPVRSLDDKDRPLQQPPFLHQHSVGLAEPLVREVGRGVPSSQLAAQDRQPLIELKRFLHALDRRLPCKA
jgi:hypothetical protein